MAQIQIYDVCSDYSLDLNETVTVYNAIELTRYLRQKHGVVKTAPVTKDHDNNLNWYGWNKYDELIIQAVEL